MLMDQASFVMSVISIFFLLLMSNAVQGRGLDDVEIERQLKVLNKPSVTTIKTDYGDIFDCVDIHKQPAFDHPLLKNHKLQKRPSFHPDQVAAAPSDMHTSRIGLEGGGCPFGTVPIRRTRKEELIAAKHFFNQHSYEPLFSEQIKVNRGYEILELKIVEGEKYYGTRQSLNIWAHQLEPEYSTAIATYVDNPPNGVVAGWMVSPSLFGDSRSRLYAYWTSDGGETTGCFNLLCPGFVQIDTRIPLGDTFRNMSVFNGPQFHIDIEVSKDIGTSGHWWLFVDGTAVGYWPKELMPQLNEYATEISWGGATKYPDGAKYAPPMGSGMWAAFNFRRACFIRRLKLKDYDASWNDLDQHIGVYRSPHGYCYGIENLWNDDDLWRHHVYVGGPKCNL